MYITPAESFLTWWCVIAFFVAFAHSALGKGGRSDIIKAYGFAIRFIVYCGIGLILVVLFK
jgi:hypothetical protein